MNRQVYGIQVYSKLLKVTDQSVSYYTFALLAVCFQPIRELLHCLHVQEVYVATLFGIHHKLGKFSC